jgi:hypothetical protein
MFARRCFPASLMAALLVTCAPALAIPVFPQSGVINDNLNIPADAEVVATQDHALTLNYNEGLPAGATVIGNNMLQATLHTEVLRDPLTQRLTFAYQLLDNDVSLVGEFSGFIMGDFGTVNPISSDVTGTGTWSYFLDADGDIVTETSGGSPHFAVTTDATDFDANGAVTMLFRKAFNITFDDPNDPDPELQTQVLSTNFTLNGTFQPSSGGGTVIPLPAGVWLGLVALSGGAAAVRLRQRLHLI